MSIIYEPRGRAAEYSPLAANLYSGCSHGCLYCYAPSATYKRKESFHANPVPRNNVIVEMKKDLKKYRGDPRPILLCFTTDPYQPIEETTKLTRLALELLIANGNSVSVLTKGGMRAARDFDLMKAGNVSFGSTLTCIDQSISTRWEPHAANPDNRISALKTAHEMGIKTWASIEPVIDPGAVYNLIRTTNGFVDLYKVGKLNYHPLAREIDWHTFRVNVESLLRSLGKSFYIKQDLQKF